MSFEFWKRAAGGVPPVKLFPSTASQTYTKGMPVSVTSGLLVIGAPAASTFVGVTNAAVTVGSDGVNTMIEVIEALPDVIFKADFTNAGTKKTFANADLHGTLFDVNATDPSVIDPDDTTNGAWVIQGYDNTNKKVYVSLASTMSAPTLG